MKHNTKLVQNSAKNGRGFKSGHKKIGGRDKGTPNKVTRAAKELYEAAFEGSGGLEALIRWIKKSNANRREFYKLHARLIPLDIQGNKETNEIDNVVVKIISAIPRPPLSDTTVAEEGALKTQTYLQK